MIVNADWSVTVVLRTPASRRERGTEKKGGTNTHSSKVICHPVSQWVCGTIKISRGLAGVYGPGAWQATVAAHARASRRRFMKEWPWLPFGQLS
jgi:hypothetical protein